MADTCQVKRESKIPARYIHECSSDFASKKRKLSKKDNNLYDVIVTEVDKSKKRIKIHYVGYSTKYDEWKPIGDAASFPFVRREKLNIPSAVSFGDREELFHGQLYREIKRKLFSGRRDDPAVRIELRVEPDVFEGGLATAVGGITERNKTVYKLPSNRLIDNFLGKKWDERIFNGNGDFAYVIHGTVRYWLSKSNPIVEFKLIGDQYVQSEIEERYFIVFTFVRGDGNRYNYSTFSNS